MIDFDSIKLRCNSIIIHLKIIGNTLFQCSETLITRRTVEEFGKEIGSIENFEFATARTKPEVRISSL